MIKTILLFFVISRSSALKDSDSSVIREILCIEVKISLSFKLLFFNLLKRSLVLLVTVISSPGLSKLLYSLADCSSNAFLSTKNTTLSARLRSIINCPALKLVRVFPPPVVHHIKPPSWS